MATRWEVEEAVMRSQIDPPGRHILLTLLSRTNAATAEIPSKHSPTFSDLESLTGYSRSTLIEWMKALGESHWFTRPILDGDTKPGMRLDVGNLSATRPKRSRTSKVSDASYRLAVRNEPGVVPPGGMDRTAERYDGVPPGGTGEQLLLLKNSPTESSNPSTNLEPSADAAGPPAKKPRTRRAKTGHDERADVEEICLYLADRIEEGGSKRPPISQKWRMEARLLLDEKRDPQATPEKVKALIDWIQGNDWWKPRVLAMPKLRAKYDEIRLDAVRDYNRKRGNAGTPSNGLAQANDNSRRDGLDRNGIRSPADQRVADAIPLYEKYKRLEEETARG